MYWFYHILFIYFFPCDFILLLLFFLLYNIVLVLPYINMHSPRLYMCSQSWTLLPPSSPYHPSGSSQCTSSKLPVSCIEPELVIHFLYDITHVSVSYSQIITTPRQSPKEYIYFKILAHTAFFIRVQYISKILKEEIEPKVNWLNGLHLKTFGYFWSFDLCITPGMWDQVFGNPHTISTFSYPKSLAGHAIGIILGNS